MSVKIAAKSTKINGKHVKVVPMFAVQANLLKFKLLAMLGKSVLSSIGQLIKASQSVKDKKDIFNHIDIDAFSESFNAMINNSTPEEFQEVIEKIVAGTFVDNVSCFDSFDDIFTGDYGLMYKVIFYSLEVNYASFFGKGGFGKILTNSAEEENQKMNAEEKK